MIPGLQNAEFMRYGSIHRNTFINSPTLLEKTLQLKEDENIFFAGQDFRCRRICRIRLDGADCRLECSRHPAGKTFQPPPETTAHGALLKYITGAGRIDFQPMNVNFGLFPPLAECSRKKDRGKRMAERAITDLRKSIR